MAEYHAADIIKNVEHLLDEERRTGKTLQEQVRAGHHPEERPGEEKFTVIKHVELNAFSKMRDVQNIDRMSEGTRFVFLKKALKSFFRVFTRPQSTYNEYNLEALKILAYNLDRAQERIARLEEKDTRSFGLSAEDPSDFSRLVQLVNAHLGAINKNAEGLQKGLITMADSLSGVLEEVGAVARRVDEVGTKQGQVYGELASSRMDVSRLWTELDMVYKSIDSRTEDMWSGISGRDAQLEKNIEASRALEHTAREIKARFLMLSEQMNMHQEMLSTLQLRLNGSTATPAGASPAAVEAATDAPKPSVPVPAMPDDPRMRLLQQQLNLVYLRFQREHRGDERELRQRQIPYMEIVSKFHEAPPLSGGPANVLDVACGDGIFLELLKERGIPSRGVDSNDAMAKAGVSRGLDIVRADAIEFLSSGPTEHYTAITAFQFVEHLPPLVLMQFLKAAWNALKPGGIILLETINPNSLYALRWFYMDLTHERLIFPEILMMLAETAGFHAVEWKGTNPVAEQFQVPLDTQSSEAKTARRLNELLFGFQDYFIVAQKPASAGRQA